MAIHTFALNQYRLRSGSARSALPGQSSGTSTDGAATATASSMYSTSPKDMYTRVTTTPPNRRIQYTLYARKNRSPHRLLGDDAHHVAIPSDFILLYFIDAEDRKSTRLNSSHSS